MKQWIMDFPMHAKDWLDEMDYCLTEGDGNPDLIIPLIRDCANSRLAKGLILGSAGTLAAGSLIQILITIRKKKSKKNEAAE